MSLVFRNALMPSENEQVLRLRLAYLMRRFIEKIKLKIEKLKLDWQFRKTKRKHQRLLKEFEETRKERQELLKNWPPKKLI